MPLLVTLLGPLLAGCPRAPHAGPPQRAPATYGVAVAAASAERTVTSVYDLRVEPLDDDVWVFTTLRSEGTWEEPGQVLTFDSEAPRASDPWPVVMQHAISSVPTAIRVVEGSPTGLVQEAGWKLEAQRAIAELGLPAAALESGQQLLDPAGVVRDLQRNFPGTPPDEGLWVREETLSGLPAVRIEVCERARSGGQTTWTCQGRVEGPEEGQARLFDTVSETTVVSDAAGLVRLETSWSGTMVFLDPDEEKVIDRPVAGQRLVQRQ